MDRTWKYEAAAFISGIHATSPLMGSGLLTTADSTTAGCSIRALSTSKGPMRYLEGEKAGTACATGSKAPLTRGYALAVAKVPTRRR